MDSLNLHSRLLLTDCGSVTKLTRGLTYGWFFEQTPPPYNLNIYNF
jgi:hypothetical protein